MCMALGFYFGNECEESKGKFLREVKDNMISIGMTWSCHLTGRKD